MKYTRPLRFLPNLRVEESTATSGYTWGRPVHSSNILKTLPLIQREQLTLPDDDIVAERWIVTDDRQFPSLVVIEDETPTPFFELLESDAKEILGERHVKEYGPYINVIMKQLDTNEQPNKGSLSVQLHPRPGHPTRPAKPEMWKGWGKAYLGWNQDMTPELIRDAVKQATLEKYMNAIDLTPERLVLVSGGLIHAVRYSTFTAEWSKAPGVDDIAKGNVKDATVSPYDRTDGKTPRPGKEDVEASIEVMTHADTFHATPAEQLFTSSQELLRDGEGNSVHALFRTNEVFVDQYHVVASIRLDLTKRGLPIYLEQGSMHILKDGKVIDQLQRGEERFIPASLGEVHIQAADQFPVIFQTWYAPLKAERGSVSL